MLYTEMNKTELEQELMKVRSLYENCIRKNLNLNLTRGKPESKQLDLSSDLLKYAEAGFEMDGTDARNYGNLEGLPSCRAYFADLLGCDADEVMIGNNASLEMMYNLISTAYLHGLLHSPRPWAQEPTVRFLCPSPGYDRHFAISKSFRMECIPVPMDENGPDMDMVEELVKDPSVKGIWCVPKYTNPDGIVYSEEICKRMAALSPSAEDFTILWDNAYCIHVFDGELDEIPDIISLCRDAGHPDMVYEFASTSKVTFAGGGICCMASSKENLAYVQSIYKYMTIGPNKVNQLLHVRFLKDKKTTMEHMAKHAAFLKPKFELMQDTLHKELEPCGIGSWTHPKGGYFVGFYAYPGTAKRIHALCKDAGVALTTAGAAFPDGIDPKDSHLRLAPSYPPISELKEALDVFCVCVRLATLEKLLSA